MTSIAPAAAPTVRWQRVALPSEHGGWGLTLEPVLLGLLARTSVAGACIGLAGLVVFLVRTPAKLAMVDLRRERWLARSRLAVRIAAAETVLVALLGGAAVATSDRPGWLLAAAAALPFAAVEWWYDVRSRGRRLVPELAGTTAIAATAAAIVVAGGGSWRTAVGVWLLLAARSMAAIPFVRNQIARVRRAPLPHSQSLTTLIAAGMAASAVALDLGLLLGGTALATLLAVHALQARRPPAAPRRIGFTQLAEGIVLVGITALGLHLHP